MFGQIKVCGECVGQGRRGYYDGLDECTEVLECGRCRGTGYLGIKPLEIEERPWGRFIVLNEHQLDGGLRIKSKILEVKPGQETSLQSHNHRDEHWIILQGKMNNSLGPNDHVFIRSGDRHMIVNGGNDLLILFELAVSIDEILESDIIRYADKYGRV